MTMIEIVENALGKKAIKNFLPMQPGYVKQTYALEQVVGFTSRIALTEGLLRFST